MAKTHSDNEIPTDMENPYLPPVTPTQTSRNSVHDSRGWGLVIVGCATLIPIYLVVLIASVTELAEESDLMSRGAVDYWRHAIASLVFLGICGATLFLAHRQSRLAKYSLVASPMFLVIMIYPGLNVVWNAIARLID